MNNSRRTFTYNGSSNQGSQANIGRVRPAQAKRPTPLRVQQEEKSFFSNFTATPSNAIPTPSISPAPQHPTSQGHTSGQAFNSGRVEVDYLSDVNAQDFLVDLGRPSILPGE